MLEFEALREARKTIREYSIRHVASIQSFRDGTRPWFKLEIDEEDLGDEKVRHRTTVATCLESLEDSGTDTGRNLIDDIAPEFARRALEEPFDEWKSDGAAYVYCRVRTLPAIIRLAPDVASEYAEGIREHLDFVWSNVALETENQGVREVTRKFGIDDGALTPQNTKESLEHAYPANAFHTFWALKTLESCNVLGSKATFVTPFEQKSQIARLWCQNMLGVQVAMHQAESDEADPNQLAWALISQFVNPRAGMSLATGELSREPLYVSALAAFFEQQLPSGKWPLGQPLFHYPSAGNAYCYTFETLAALLGPALFETPLGKLLRELLKPHLEQLLKAWEFARRTARPLEVGKSAVGWSSGHHPHRTKAEGWASASVFAFIERLRRLLGAYTREAAAAQLGVRASRFLAADSGENKLVERGFTWAGPRHWTAGEQVASLFLHPVKASMVPVEAIDPDQSLIDKYQARSAILFGPPGTSKTTLVEALAGALGWDFVEIHASDFLVEGMDKVPTSADAIFAKLMELDRCVVLFDEIDELLRNRKDKDADPFGRFLTTSMLPKVATLWDQGRVIFFVATNDIAGADPAIKRSQRFDSAVFVAPPSFDTKIRELRKQLPAADFSWLTEDLVEAALLDGENEPENELGYFALLRFDQIEEFVDLLRSTSLDAEAVKAALREMGARFKKNDWQPRGSNGRRNPYQMFNDMRESETRDHRMKRLVLVEGASIKNSGYQVVVLGAGHVTQPPWTYLRLIGSPVRPPSSISKDDKGTCHPDPILRYT